MKVRATQIGFWGGSRVRPGQEFDVPEGTRAPWFVPVEHAGKAARPAKADPPAPRTLSEMSRAVPAGPVPVGASDLV